MVSGSVMPVGQGSVEVMGDPENDTGRGRQEDLSDLT
jgi:hypothetical protein